MGSPESKSPVKENGEGPYFVAFSIMDEDGQSRLVVTDAITRVHAERILEEIEGAYAWQEVIEVSK